MPPRPADVEKVEILNAFFSSVFTSKDLPSGLLDGREKVQEMESFPLFEEGVVQEHLGGINVHKSTGPDGIHVC